MKRKQVLGNAIGLGGVLLLFVHFGLQNHWMNSRSGVADAALGYTCPAQIKMVIVHLDPSECAFFEWAPVVGYALVALGMALRFRAG